MAARMNGKRCCRSGCRQMGMYERMAEVGRGVRLNIVTFAQLQS